MCSTVSHYNSNNSQTTYSFGTLTINSISYANIIRVLVESCAVDVAAHCSSGTHATQQLCENAGNTWIAATYAFSGSQAEFACLYNRVQAVMTSAGGALVADSTSGMESNFAIFYQLLLNLISASYGKDYTDPIERTEAGSYTELGRSDASLKTAVETMKSRVDTTIGLHNTERGLITTAMAGTNAYTITAGYKTVYDSMAAYMTTFKNAVQYRISEISNRIGYLNGKDTAVRFLMGQVMKITKGKANPSVVNSVLESKLQSLKQQERS